MKKKKVAIIGTAGVPSRYGGFETLAHNLVLNLNQKYDLHVYASKKNYAKQERVKRWKNARIHYLPMSANGVWSIIYDIISMIHAMFYADQLIILGVSGGIFVPFVRFFSKAKIVVNIDGLEWRRDKWGKKTKKFLKYSEYIAVKYSHADITDNEAIKRYTAIFYKTASHLIAYGADHVSPRKLNKADYEKYPFLRKPYAFKVARIEPENNIEMILAAFAKKVTKNLVVVGNWNHSEYARNLRKDFSQFPNIFLLDPIYNQKKLDKLRSNCFLYVHGHSAGGTNPSLVEAMMLKLPIFSYDVSYNRATTQNEAVYFKNVDHLIDLLDEIPYKRLRAVSEKMYEIASFRYSWIYISGRYASIIESFDYNYSKPKMSRNDTNMSYDELLKSGYAHLDHKKYFFEGNLKPNQNGK